MGAMLAVFGRAGCCLSRLAALALISACGFERPSEGTALFADVTAELGLPGPGDWPDGTYFLPEIMQGGIALFDADGDGVLELLQVRIPPPGGTESALSNRMYRRSQPAGSFRDVTREAGLDEPGYGQALAVGDTDNDGDLDVFVANYGPDRFYVNAGDGSFTGATERAGLVEDGWSTAAAFCDYDADGFQDLYLVRYQRFDAGKVCTDASSRREYCGPILGAQDSLFHNEGDGTFTDRTAEAGIVLPQRGARATGLGIVFLDLTQDGRPDIFVANDAQANQLWVNQGDGRFIDQAVQRGVAFDRDGRTEANMGVAVGDVNGDGYIDLLTTHLWMENNRLYLGTELPLFRDHTIGSGLSRHDLERTGFGCGFFDFDHDGDQDLAVVNGGVHRRPPLPGAPAGFWADYAEPNQLFENDGSAVFALADAKAGGFASEVEVSRGLAFGDLDADGDLDLVVSNIDNSLRVYRNDAPPRGSHWLLVRALTHGRDALGAQILVRAGEREFLGLVLAAYSYAVSSDPRAHFGLGSIDSIDAIQVLWPDGQRELFPGTPVDREITLQRGEGRAP
jgi:hypothetical protein